MLKSSFVIVLATKYSIPVVTKVTGTKNRMLILTKTLGLHNSFTSPVKDAV